MTKQQNSLVMKREYNKATLHDVFETIANQSSVTLDGNHHLNELMYADDLIILATSMEVLQKSLDSLGEYGAKWKLDINYNKTKCMTFSKDTQKEKQFHNKPPNYRKC